MRRVYRQDRLGEKDARLKEPSEKKMKSQLPNTRVNNRQH